MVNYLFGLQMILSSFVDRGKVHHSKQTVDVHHHHQQQEVIGVIIITLLLLST